MKAFGLLLLLLQFGEIGLNTNSVRHLAMSQSALLTR
jgi:hypothetical protein